MKEEIESTLNAILAHIERNPSMANIQHIENLTKTVLQQVNSVDLDNVGGSYRMLKEGEKIQAGDEFIDNNGKWRLSGRFDEYYTGSDYYPHRRLM